MVRNLTESEWNWRTWAFVIGILGIVIMITSLMWGEGKHWIPLILHLLIGVLVLILSKVLIKVKGGPD